MINTAASLRESTLLAWSQVIDSLLEVSFGAGISVQDVTQLLRKRSVRAAAEQIARDGGHASKSRIAIMTGMPRSEVALALKVLKLPTPHQKQPPANSVLEAWHSNPAFLTKAGKPGVLPIFGKDRTFEQLVRSNGRGTPVRAMLDQLLELRAITVLRDRRVKVRKRSAVAAGLSDASIANLGERTSDFIETLKRNLRKPSNSLFERTTVGWANAEALPQVRAQIEEHGANFVNTVSLIMKHSRSNLSTRTREPADSRKIGITVFYFEKKPPDDVSHPNLLTRRKNFKRAARTS